MTKTVLKKIAQGISWGCTLFCLFNIIAIQTFGTEWLSKEIYTKQIIFSCICGIGWVLPTIIYQNERLSNTQQILIHLSIGFLVYIPCMIAGGWVPIQNGFYAILISIICGIAISLTIWAIFYFYYKNEAKKMNEQIKKKIIDEK